MTKTACRLTFISACCLLVACSSGSGQNDAGSNSADDGPTAGADGLSADGGEVQEAGDDAGEAGDRTADVVAEAGDAVSADRSDAADLPADKAATDAPMDLPVDRAPTNLANGAACQAPSWCRSKFCVDGVCCDSACGADDPMRCTACTMAKTGQPNGACAADRARDHMKCGEACGPFAINVSAVFAMICQAGQCTVPATRTVVGAPCTVPGDPCSVSFCDQPTDRSARCVSTLCPQNGTCCCQMGDNMASRSCTTMNSCKNDRACVSQ